MTTHSRSEVPPPPNLTAPQSPPQQPGQAPAGAPAPAVRTAAAPRQWNRKLLLASLLIVLLGGLVAMWAGQALVQRSSVLAVAKPVAVGATITDADLTTATISSDPRLKPIPARDRASVVGQVALVELRPGSLLTRDQVGTSDGFTSGQQLVALPLKVGQLPGRGLTAGQKVLIVQTPGKESTDAPALPGAAAGIPATIAGVGQFDAASGLTVVDVRVESSVGVTVAQLASTGDLALILLPAGG